MAEACSHFVIRVLERNHSLRVAIEFAANFFARRGHPDCDRTPTRMITVLFVSQDVDLRAAAARVLTMAGCQVTTAAHAGHASLACRDRDAFDVLVIEDDRADGSGTALAGRVRQYYPGVQVVTLVRPFTAHDLIGAVSDATHYTRRLTISR